MIFLISTDLDKASKITKSSFSGLNIWERQHIEEWVRTNPEMLGEDLLVVRLCSVPYSIPLPAEFCKRLHR